MKRSTLFLILAIALFIILRGYIPDKGEGGFTAHERALIHGADSTMRVLTIEDSLILKMIEKMEIQKEHFLNRVKQALNKRVA